MPVMRIAVANIRFPPTPEDTVLLASQAIRQAGIEGADIICFPEAYVSGYLGFGRVIPPSDPVFLERAWATLAAAARLRGGAVNSFDGQQRTFSEHAMTIRSIKIRRNSMPSVIRNRGSSSIERCRD
jgi:hypothetical protein